LEPARPSPARVLRHRRLYRWQELSTPVRWRSRVLSHHPPRIHSLPARHFPHRRRRIRAISGEFDVDVDEYGDGGGPQVDTEKVCSSTLTELELEMEEQEGRGITEIEKRGKVRCERARGNPALLLVLVLTPPMPSPRSSCFPSSVILEHALRLRLKSSPHSQLEPEPETVGMYAARVYVCAASVLELIVEQSRRGVRAYPRRRRCLLPARVSSYAGTEGQPACALCMCTWIGYGLRCGCALACPWMKRDLSLGARPRAGSASLLHTCRIVRRTLRPSLFCEYG
jgi:hypothetical protein